MKKLYNTMEKLRNNPVLLQQYHDTIESTRKSNHRRSGLTEHGGRIIHYLARQAILTPHKNTTKLRVVFDASAHHENCPSLNDMLNEGPKVLGIPWNTERDELTLTCTYPPKKTCTKRSVSEQVAAVYDPHGWLTPLTLKGKQFLQQLWKNGYDWDTNLSIDHQQQWDEIVRNAGFQHRTPRKIAEIHQPPRLVVFADASAQSMATCAYLVTNNVAHLIAGKSKLPAIKGSPTIPKLELNALTMATRLTLSIYKAIRSKSTIESIVILSDSKVTLSWISKVQPDRNAVVLVRNRTREIQEIVETLPVPVSFGYVPTCDNPADCGTRGVTKYEFENHIWWTGPTFIATPTDEWSNKIRLMRLPIDSEENDSDCY
uniref:RNase H domain-containing protein n=1 Tax=Haemonchus placei TaxID=6290 RepID=A0A0N4WP43_HAEPC